jgi:hypothetical protein
MRRSLLLSLARLGGADQPLMALGEHILSFCGYQWFPHDHSGARACEACGVIPKDPKRCSRCKQAWFCSVDCQR